MFGSLLKAAVGVVVKTPVALLADVVTMGGAVNDKRGGPYTADAIREVFQNLDNATKPSR